MEATNARATFAPALGLALALAFGFGLDLAFVPATIRVELEIDFLGGGVPTLTGRALLDEPGVCSFPPFSALSLDHE